MAERNGSMSLKMLPTVVVGAFGIPLIAAAFSRGSSLLVVCLFVAAGMFGEVLSLQLPHGTYSMGASVLFSSVLIFGWHFSVICQAIVSTLEGLLRKRPWYRTAFNAFQTSISVTAAAAVYRLLGGAGIALLSPAAVFAALFAWLVYEFCNLMFVLGAIWWETRLPLRTISKGVVGPTGPVVPFVGVMAICLAEAYIAGGRLTFLVFLGLHYLSYWAMASFSLKLQNRDLAARYSDTQAYLRDLVAGMLNGVVAVDEERRVTMVNKAAEGLLGREAQALLDAPLSALTDDGLTSSLEQALVSGHNFPAREMVLRRDGQTTEVLCSVSALRDAGGNVSGAVAVLQDITEQKQIERRLGHLDRLALLGEFAAGVVHEINNPLAMVSMALDNAAAGIADGEVELAGEDILMARRNVGRLQKLSRQLLSFSRPVPAELGWVDVGRALNEVLNIVAPQARTNSVRVQRQVPEGLMLLAEESVLEQVFLNLAANAMQAMPAGGELAVTAGKARTSVRDLGAVSGSGEADQWERSVRILGPVVSPEADAEARDYIWVNFSDTGVGMSRESLELVGRSFYTTKEQGTGLGIAVVSKLLAQYRGVLEIKSRPGVGSSFCLWFPELGEAELREAVMATGTETLEYPAAGAGGGFRAAESRGLFGLVEAEAAAAGE